MRTILSVPRPQSAARAGDGVLAAVIVTGWATKDMATIRAAPVARRAVRRRKR